MIVLIGATKGGNGKSLLACNLAAKRASEGLDVLLLDGDRQGSASLWSELRAETEPKITCMQKFGKGLQKEIRALAPKFDDIVIDCGGYDSLELRAALVCCHKVYIPTQPGQFDVDALYNMEELIENARQYNDELQARVLVTRVSTNPVLHVEAREVYAFVERECPNLRMASHLIYERVAWRRCLREGLAVFEMKPKDMKAVAELDRLYEEIWRGV